MATVTDLLPAVEAMLFVAEEPVPVGEIAEVLEVSVRTVKRQWRYTKAWLYREIGSH